MAANGVPFLRPVLAWRHHADGRHCDGNVHCTGFLGSHDMPLHMV